jgi:hypothetical protein
MTTSSPNTVPLSPTGPPLPSISSITPIFATGSFIVGIAINAAITGGVNYVIDQHKLNAMSESPATRENALVLVNHDTAAEVLIFTLIVSLASFFLGSPSVIKSIIAGKSRSISAATLAVSPLYQVAGQPGKRSALRFVLSSLIFPGAVVALTLAAMCYRHIPEGSATFVCYASSVPDALYFIVAWKSVIAAIVYIFNYVACHNDSQPELTVSTKAAKSE